MPRSGSTFEPFLALLAPDLEWRGVERGHLWWRAERFG
jgi:hypothetical protein